RDSLERTRRSPVPQRQRGGRLKRIGAAAYDYENDSRWAGYWSNVLVPPHLASRPDVVDHFKRKFYQRYIVSPPPARLRFFRA
ncbi:Os01g0604700, partial [Oryza sativa Japonica Group]